jgi:hypothetical protein
VSALSSEYHGPMLGPPRLTRNASVVACRWRVRHLLPEAVRIIDTQDLNSLRQERETLLLERLQVQ